MRVAILGYGMEGRVNYKYWLSQGADVTIVDQKSSIDDVPPKAKTILGSDAPNQLNDFDLVIRTASFNPTKISTNGKIWSATNEFFTQCPAPIIGVTGTKGKGTTCSLITQMLRTSGQTVHLVGNIGIPALEILPTIEPEDIVVFELSSFQLWDLEKSPETAVVLMIEPDHQDVHGSMEEYVVAKAQIAVHQQEDDLLVYHPADQYSQQIADLSPALSKKRYQTPEGAYVRGESIVIYDQIICAVSEVGLLGKHNLDNICAALTATWYYTQDKSAIKSAIVSFKGLPHRLELAGEASGIRYYDDSQATSVGSTLAAIRSFSEPTILILGGSDKGIDVSEVLRELDPQRHFVVLIGQSAERLENDLKKQNFTQYINLGQEVTMSAIVAEATARSQSGGVVLLSPAHASFGMFKNYQDRGDQFKSAVTSLASKN